MKTLNAINSFTQWKYLQVKQNTIYGYDGHLRHFCIYVKNCDIENITLEQVQEYLTLAKEIGYKPNCLEKWCMALKELFSYWGKRGHKVIDPDLVPMVEKEYTMPRVASDEDFVKLLKAIPYSEAYYNIRDRAILWLLHDTGCRLSEVSSLRIQDIGKKEAVITAGKQRSKMPFAKVFWTEKCQEALDDWIDKRKELIMKTRLPEEDKDFLFISVNGGVCGNGKSARRMDIEAIGESLRKLSNRAGLKYNVNPHSFRHRMGKELAKRGLNNSVISQFLHHSNLESSRIYTNLFSQDLRKIYQKVFK